MKLDRIVLENFGVYARQKFQFDSAPLVLVYGPNESGKTTALNGLRAAMFGFPSRTPYLTGKPMAAEVHGALSDGSTFQFTRKKARKDEINGKHGARRLDADDLNLLFGHMDLDSYQQLFGFSLEELRIGEASLKSARLSEALAGGGMGGASMLQNLREELLSSTTALYRSRGSSQIATLLSEIKSHQDQLKSLQILPQAVEELRSRLRSAMERGEAAKEQYAQLHQALSRTEKLKQAWPKHQAIQRIDQQLAEIEIPAGVDATFIAQWSDYAQQQANLNRTVAQDKEQLAAEQQRLASLAGSNSTPELDGRIESLGHQAAEIAKLRKQLIDVSRQHDEAQAGCKRALEILGETEAQPAFLKFAISAPQRNKLENWIATAERIHNELLSVTAKLESTSDQWNSIEQQTTTGEIPDNLARLSELVTKIRDEEVALEQLVESVCEKCESPEFEIAGARLRSRLPDCPTLDYSWPVLASVDVARFTRLFEEQARNVIQFEREIQRLAAERVTSQRELEELERNSERTAWGELRQVGSERDQLIQNWLDDLSEPLIACSITADLQKLRLQQLQLILQRSDGLVHQIVDTAETIAKISQAQKHLQAIDENIASLHSQLSQEVARRESLQSQWYEAWVNCPFQPLAPELMANWVAEFEAWSRVAAELDIERRKLMSRRGVVKQLRGELVDQWPTVIEFEATWQSLAEQLERWTQFARTTQTESARLNSMQAMKAELEQRQAELTAKQQEIAASYASWLREHELPITWPLAQATVLVDGIDRLKRDLQSTKRCELQIQESAAQIAAFETAVKAIASESERDALPAEVLAQRWLTNLQSSRKDSAERSKLSASIEHRTTRLAEMTARLNEIEERLSTLSASVANSQGDLDREAFDVLMQRAQHATKLRVERSELSSAIDMLAGRESIDEFIHELTEIDDSSLSLRIAETKRTLTQCEATRQQADQEVGAIASQLEQLAKSEAAQRSQQLLQAQRGQLAELAEQWVVSRLAQELLTRCIDRFTHDNEPALLQLTHQFLSKLTGGRYTSVEHSADGGFCVRNAREEAIEPSKLSTGTREQLYLAIRMAFITNYTEQHEPLPVLMDDCFVNFDDARTRLALQTLLGWKNSVQTILLSCHGRVVQQLAELAPETPVICLDRNATHSARDVVGELQLTH